MKKNQAHISNLAIPYVISLFSIFVATVLRLWPLSALELRIPWVTFYPAVMVCAIYSGFRSGLFTTFLSVFVVLFWSFTGTPFIDDPGDWLGLFIFSLNSVFISIMGGMMHQAKRTAIRLKDEAEDAKNMLEEKVLERTKELYQSVSQLRNLFANSPFPIMVHSEDGRIIMINQAWTELTGYDIFDIPTLSDWVKNAYGENFNKIDLKIAPHLTVENRVDEGEIQIRTKDGNTIVWDFSSALLGENANGQKLIVSMAKDITYKKALESKLNQSQKMEAIGTLAGGIAHDFNNLLSVIIGYTYMIIENLPKDSQNVSDLQEVHKAASRAKDLVSQILTFSRQDNQELIPLKIDLILKEVMKLLRSTIPTTIDIRLNLESNCKSVLANPTQVHQVILNLCTNAYHAMRDNGGVLNIKLETVVLPRDDTTSMHIQAGEYVKLSVSDTGIGISKKNQEKIFDPYFTTKAKGEGTGLGLAVVHGIVKQYNGEITVNSKPGEGTTFCVYLPAIMDNIESKANERTSSLPRGNESILVIDDDEKIVKLNKRVLENMGYHVIALTKSEEALNTFQQTPESIDLVLTDMTMPHMTGAELTKKLIAIRPDIPIIMCTGFSDQIDKDEAIKMGISDFLMKPVDMITLVLAVRKALDKSPKN